MRTVTQSAAQPALPPVDSIMMLAMFASGIAAAVTSDPRLWLITPVVAYIVLRAARRANAGDAEQAAPSEFPSRVDDSVSDALDRLPSGDAHRLLADVVREARPVFAMSSSSFDASSEAAARIQAEELVVAACDTALELARIDLALESRKNRRGSPESNDESLLNRLITARQLFAKRLSDSADALSAWYASGVEHGTPASDRIAELVTDLKADANARNAAKRELDELLSPNSTVG